MAPSADRIREQLIERLGNDSRLGKAKVVSATPVIRGSVVAMMLSGILGGMALQIILGSSAVSFALGLAVGYGAYIGYKILTMGEPKVIAAMAVLTRDKLILLGSRRVGIAAEWKRKDIEGIDVLRKGNLMIMGKISIRPVGAEPIQFFLSNPKVGRHLVEAFNEGRR